MVMLVTLLSSNSYRNLQLGVEPTSVHSLSQTAESHCLYLLQKNSHNYSHMNPPTPNGVKNYTLPILIPVSQRR